MGKIRVKLELTEEFPRRHQDFIRTSLAFFFSK